MRLGRATARMHRRQSQPVGGRARTNEGRRERETKKLRDLEIEGTSRLHGDGHGHGPTGRTDRQRSCRSSLGAGPPGAGRAGRAGGAGRRAGRTRFPGRSPSRPLPQQNSSCIWAHMYMHMCTHAHVHMCMHMHKHVHVHVHVHAHVCTCTCDMYMHMCMCMHMYKHVHAHVHVHVCACTCTCTCTCTCDMHMCGHVSDMCQPRTAPHARRAPAGRPKS